MFDTRAVALLKPLVDRLAKSLQGVGVSANALTLIGFGIGINAAMLIAFEFYRSAIILILLSRLCDGLDGAVARLGNQSGNQNGNPSDKGGYMDITLDFLFYASIPLAFAYANPSANALAAATLLAAFMGTATSFLAFAVIAEKQQRKSSAYPNKSFYFLGGLTEATETLVAFIAMCVWPQTFALIAFGFAGLCAVTIVMRVWHGWQVL